MSDVTEDARVLEDGAINGALSTAARVSTSPVGGDRQKPGGRARLLTAEELAARWQVPRSQVYRLAREGRIPLVRVGRYVRFSPASIEAFEGHGG